jgi:integrase
MAFDQILAKARQSTGSHQRRSDLSEAEIEHIVKYHYALILDVDEYLRTMGGSEAIFQAVYRQLEDAGIDFKSSYPKAPPPVFGLSDRDMRRKAETIDNVLPAAQVALARGDIGFVAEDLTHLLEDLGIELDTTGLAYRRLGVALLRANVAALKAIAQRLVGEPIETPAIDRPVPVAITQSETLTAALEGWKKFKARPAGTVREFEHGIQRFIQLHGDLQIASLSRTHVREFREALQAIPVRRAGGLRQAPLRQLVEWRAKHPDAPAISAGTINKLLGAVQTVAIWGRDNGLVPDDVAWSDPFSNMRLDEREPDREPWRIDELRKLFDSWIYVAGARPKGGHGEAAHWLPLLGLYTGARLSELAQLLASDIVTDDETGVIAIEFTEDAASGKRLKTLSSRRTVPVHPALERLGFSKFVDERRGSNGPSAPPFPLLGSSKESAQWSKWFGRYIRQLGIERAVFHLFRHGFKDALRAAGESQDINDALTGHSSGGVGQRYGAKEMVRRFGLRRLSEAVAKLGYPGLDLGHLEGKVQSKTNCP